MPETQTININHNKVNQSFKEFACLIKNLVSKSLNHTKRKDMQYATTLYKNSSTP